MTDPRDTERAALIRWGENVIADSIRELDRRLSATGHRVTAISLLDHRPNEPLGVAIAAAPVVAVGCPLDWPAHLTTPGTCAVCGDVRPCVGTAP